jgi:predicted DNA-binding protein with PD1-like motif
VLRIEITPGQEVMEVLTASLQEHKIAEGTMTLIGAVDLATISTMPAHDATQDILTTYTEPLELTGTGEVVDGKPHVHVILCREGDTTVGGHLHRATVKTFFVRAYVTRLV